MTEAHRPKLSIRDRLMSLSPNRIAERRMQTSIQNVASSLTLDVIKKTRLFYQSQGLEMPIEEQMRLSRFQEDACMVLAKNGTLDTQRTQDIYAELNWPIE